MFFLCGEDTLSFDELEWLTCFPLGYTWSFWCSAHSFQTLGCLGKCLPGSLGTPEYLYISCCQYACLSDQPGVCHLGSQITLVASHWPHTEWCPDLLALLVEAPRDPPLALFTVSTCFQVASATEYQEANHLWMVFRMGSLSLYLNLLCSTSWTYLCTFVETGQSLLLLSVPVVKLFVFPFVGHGPLILSRVVQSLRSCWQLCPPY